MLHDSGIIRRRIFLLFLCAGRRQLPKNKMRAAITREENVKIQFCTTKRYIDELASK